MDTVDRDRLAELRRQLESPAGVSELEEIRKEIIHLEEPIRRLARAKDTPVPTSTTSGGSIQ